MTYTIYPIAAHPGEKAVSTPGCYIMIDGYMLCCESSSELYNKGEFEDVVAELQEELGGDAHYALVVTNEDQTTKVIDWA